MKVEQLMKKLEKEGWVGDGQNAGKPSPIPASRKERDGHCGRKAKCRYTAGYIGEHPQAGWSKIVARKMS